MGSRGVRGPLVGRFGGDDWHAWRMSVFGRTLLIAGPESLLASRAAEQRLAEARQEREGVQVNRVSAAELDGNTLAEVTGGSLFAADAVTVVEDIGSMPPELVDQVVGLAADTPAELALVLIHPGGVKGKGLLDKLKKLKIEQIQAAAIKAWDVPTFVLAEARSTGVRLDADAAHALVAAVGTDLRALVGALDQLASDSEGNVTVAAINKYFAGRAEVSSFNVADAVIAGDRPQALERLRWALGTGVPAVLLTSAMASGLRGLGKYLDARSLRMSQFDLAKHIGVPPFKVKDFQRTSKGWTPEAVASSLVAVAEADAQVKGASTDPEFALERMVLHIVAQRRN